MRTSGKRGIRLRAFKLAATAGVVVVAVATKPLVASAFTNFRPPLTGASDFVTGFPTCHTDTPMPAGPVGLTFDANNFYVDDVCSHTLLKFPLSGGTYGSPTASAANTFGGGLAVSHGNYFGLELGNNSPSANGLHAFDPVTLAKGPQLVPFCDSIGIAADPLTTDLYIVDFGSNCGLTGRSSPAIYKVQNPTGTPTTTVFATGFFDGLYFGPDGKLVASKKLNQHVLEFDRSGNTLFNADLSGHGPDAPAIDPAGNVFINSNDGTVEKIDSASPHAVTVVASGGTRGDFATIGPDGCLYVTQTDRVQKLTPCLFTAAPPPPPPQLKPPNTGAGAPYAIGLVLLSVGAGVLGISRRRSRNPNTV